MSVLNGNEQVSIATTSERGVVKADGTTVHVAADGTLSAPGGSTSPLTTKGDLYGFDTADARIPVGADGTVLTADSTQALGVKWDPPSAAGVTSLNSLTGALAITAGTGITVTPSGSNIDIALGTTGYPTVVDSYTSSTPETTTFTRNFPTLPAGIYRVNVYISLTSVTGSGTSTVSAVTAFTDYETGVNITTTTVAQTAPFTGNTVNTGTYTFYSSGAAMTITVTPTNTGSAVGTFVVQAITLERLA